MSGAILALRKPKDFFLGLIFMTVAVVLVVYTRQYDAGTARQMGPGYLPLVLGLLLGGFGVFSVVSSFFGEPETAEPLELRACALILLATALFGILIRPAGLLVSTFILVIVAGAAYRSRRPIPLFLYAIALAVGCVVVFPWLLGQQIPVLGSWFDR